MRTICARVGRARPTEPAVGGFDRVHDGLVSGWFVCPGCGLQPKSRLGLLLDGQRVVAIASATPRGDVPGGQGFLFRFPPVRATAPRVLVQCPDHMDQGLEVKADPTDWRTGVLGAIETSSWPIVTGWVALIDPTDSAPELAIVGHACWPVRVTAPRPDVQAHLGDAGVGGFQFDLGATLGAGSGPPLRTALPDGTALQLIARGRVLTTAAVEDSPLGPDDPGCIAAVAGPRPGVDEQAEVNLRRRFLTTEIDPEGDWRDLLTRLGLETHSAEVEQWAAYLLHLGRSNMEVASWLAIRATQWLGANAVSPLPLTLQRASVAVSAEMPKSVLAWADSVRGVNQNSYVPVLPAPAAEVPTAVDKVLVAGLVNHRSGLGQNARNSLRALELAGIHGCVAPFFPAPGGWNPRLTGRGNSEPASEDHAVLLHLPIDQVIPSLSAQSSLLRTDRLIGYFMWETDVIPRQFYRALDLVDEIWTATDFVADSFRAVTETPVHVTGHVVDVSGVETVVREDLGIPIHAFVVHYAFDANSTVARKNPNDAIDAFQLALGDDPDSVFILKVRNFPQVEWQARSGDPYARGLLDRLASHPKVRLVTGEWSHARTLGLIDMSDCYLSLHRAEGFGYGMAEAFLLGTPVVATRYSGVAEHLGEAGVWLIGSDLVSMEPGDYFYWEPGMVWAQPRLREAAQALIEVRNCRPEQRWVAPSESTFSLRALASVYASRLRE